MQTVDSLISASWVIPVEPSCEPIDDGAIAVLDGRIAGVGERRQMQQRFVPSVQIDRPGHVLLPGLVNAHGHAAMTLLRGQGDDLALKDWLEGRIWPLEAKWVSDSFVEDGARLAILEMLLGGTTTAMDMYFFPEAATRAALEIGMRWVMGIIAIEFPSAYGAGIDEYLKKGLATRDRYQGDPLFGAAFAPHAPYTVSDATLTRVRSLADELEIPIQMHVHETALEVSEAVAESGVRPLARLKALGLLTPSFMVVHGTQLSEAEIEDLAAAGSHLVHCPRSNLKLNAGFAPVSELLQAGVNVALGTDGAASNNRLDLWAEIDAAALVGKWVGNDATHPNAAQALTMATAAGARALGLEADLGTLTPGKWADVIAVDLRGPNTQPLHDVVSQVVYAAGRDQVSDVWVAGRHLVSDGKPTTTDAETTLEKARHWAQRIQQHAT